jgi:hypothetical protein
MFGQFLKGGLNRPTFSVKVGDLLGIDLLGRIGENKHVPFAVACGLIEMDTEATQPQFGTLRIPDDGRLLTIAPSTGPPCLNFPSGSQGGL